MTFKKYSDANEPTLENGTSKLNAAGLINSALESLWGKCYTAMSNGNLVQWNRNLDAIWTILGGDCLEKDTNDTAFAKINLSIYNTGSLNHKKTGFQTINSDEATRMSLQYLLLNKKSLFLRRLQNSQGKGTAYRNEDDDDID